MPTWGHEVDVTYRIPKTLSLSSPPQIGPIDVHPTGMNMGGQNLVPFGLLQGCSASQRDTRSRSHAKLYPLNTGLPEPRGFLKRAERLFSFND